MLFKENSLCYLTEILDSAQEGFPFLWVNGEKYVFSQEVLEAGTKLFQGFLKLQNVFRNIYNIICEENVDITIQEITEQLQKNLEEFDSCWVGFEQLYVLELMLIEADARRFITDAIDTEKELSAIEEREKQKGRILLECEDYNICRKKLVKVIGQLNSVANSEGTGRDDLALDILVSAESVVRRVSSSQSKAVRALAEAIKKSFHSLRMLFRKYRENIEVVDPQLKNNPELVEALSSFENYWEKGKT